MCLTKALFEKDFQSWHRLCIELCSYQFFSNAYRRQLDAGNTSRSKDMKDHVEQGLALAGMLVVLVGVMFAAAAALT